MTPRSANLEAARLAASRSFGWPIFDRALLLAMIYPLITVLVYWTFSGEDGGMADALILPGEDSSSRRTLAIGIIVLTILAFPTFRKISVRVTGAIGKYWNLLGICAATAAFAIAFPSALIFAFAGSSGIEAAFAGTGGVAYSIAFALSFAGAVAIAGSSTLAAAVASTVALTAIAFSLPAAVGDVTALPSDSLDGIADYAREQNNRNFVNLAVSYATIFAIAIFVTVAGAVLGAVAFAASARRGFGSVGYGVLTVTFLAIAIMAAGNPFSERQLGEQPSGIVLGLAILPLCNGLFDFLSYGCTLSLIRRGMKWGRAWPYILAILDLVVALFLFTGLGVLLLLSISAVNTVSTMEIGNFNQDVYDVEGFFAEIGSGEGMRAHAWLPFVLFTTAIPTLVHYLIAATSLQAWAP